MKLRDKQWLFARCLARLILKAELMGYELTFGETYRPEERAASYSVHPMRLAVDLNLFIDGEYRKDTEAHEALGRYWESMHSLCRWGGRFKKKDGNHYSLTHGGKA